MNKPFFWHWLILSQFMFLLKKATTLLEFFSPLNNSVLAHATGMQEGGKQNEGDVNIANIANCLPKNSLGNFVGFFDLCRPRPI